MSVTKIAIIGAGNWSRNMHLPALKVMLHEKIISVVGVCDLDKELAQKYATELDCNGVFSELANMIKEVRPEGIVILVPPEVSHLLIQEAIDLKIPFLCEKPPVKESTNHLKLSQEIGDLKHLIAYNRRFSPYIRQAKEWMKGVEVQSVTAQFSRHKRMDDDFSTTAVHAIDTTQFLGGENFETGRVEVNRKGGVANIYVNGWSKSKIRFDVLISPNTGSAEEKYIVRGTERSVLISFPQRNMYDAPGYVELHENNQVQKRKSANDFGLSEEDSSGLGGILNEHKEFIKVLKEDLLSESTLENTYATQVIREEVYKLIVGGSDYCFNDIEI